MTRLHPRAALSFALLLGAAGCRRCAGPDAHEPVVASFEGGKVTAAELERERQKMPPYLRQQFDTPAGRRELAGSLLDKKLLGWEGTRRGLRTDPEIRRQVDELEERLVAQALLAQEERKAPPLGEAEQRDWYEAHKSELAEPERLRLSRLLFASAREKAGQEPVRARAARAAARLRGGAAFAEVAREGSGPEKERGGDLGLVARGDLPPDQEKAAFALQKSGEVAGPVELADGGVAVLQLVERRPARIPPFEEVRAKVQEKLEPARKRRAFDALIGALRRETQARVGDAPAK